MGHPRRAREARRRAATPRSRRSATTSPPAWTRRAVEKLGRQAARSRYLDRIAAMKSQAATCRAVLGDLHLRHRRLAASSSASARTRTSPTRRSVIAFAERRRPGPAGPRLLPEGRRQVEGASAPSTWRTSRSMFELLGDAPDAGEARRRHGDGDRDRAREGLAHARRAARSRTSSSTRWTCKALQALDARRSTGTPTCARSGRAERRRASTSPSRRSSRSSDAAVGSRASTTSRRTCAGTWRTRLAPYLSQRVRRTRTSTSSARRCAACQQLRPRWKRCVALVDRAARRSARPGVRRAAPSRRS